MVLPKMSGLKVAERILELCPDMRIIYTSGYPGKADIPELQDGFGKTFLEKPFTPDSLLRKVRTMLDCPE